MAWLVKIRIDSCIRNIPSNIADINELSNEHKYDLLIFTEYNTAHLVQKRDVKEWYIKGEVPM